MADDPVIIGSEIKYVVTATTKVIGLFRPSVGVLNTFSLHEESTGADYVVPASKKLILLSISAFPVETTTYSTNIIWSSGSADSATGTTVYRNVIGGNGSTGTPAVNNNVHIEFAAGQYVNSQENGMSCGITARGIEVDA